jgi:hypothetical protein
MEYEEWKVRIGAGEFNLENGSCAGILEQSMGAIGTE